MTTSIFAYIPHKAGKADDTAVELAVAARKIDPNLPVTAIVVGSGVDSVCNEAAAFYKTVWKIDHRDMSYPNAEAIRPLLAKILPKESILLVPHDTFGMDLAPGLSIKLDSAFAADVVGIQGIENGKLKVVRQEYSGMVSTHLLCDLSGGAVITIRPGSFQPEDEKEGTGGEVIDKTGEAGDIPKPGRRFLKVAEAEKGDVDITKSEILIAVGRGIEDQDNLQIIHDLAKAMGGDVACSRPIVDAKWLEKSRQVGTSGQTVKPKVYLALGISGAFQHIGGIKGAPFMVAVNKNPKSPIFQFADVGIVADILEFIPELTEKIKSS
jgi:electron transfer flavoprotein alpha subunit